jgi:DNA-binding IclR family transcriptional regulator
MVKKKLIANLATNDTAGIRRMAKRSSGTSEKARRRKPKVKAKSLVAPEMAQTTEYHSKAIGRALEVMDYFPNAETSLSLTELSNLSGFPESSLFRILSTLENYRYLQRNSDGSYRLAPKVLFGTLYDRAEQVKETVRPFLQHLNHLFDETISLAFLFGDKAQVIDMVEAFQSIRAANVIGRVLPPHCSSLAKAITAFQSPERINRIVQVYGLPPHTERTITDRLTLLAEYEQIRLQGWSREIEESALGRCCFGAPLIDAQGYCIAAISVSCPAIRITPKREAEIIQELVKVAREASRAIQTPTSDKDFLPCPAAALF